MGLSAPALCGFAILWLATGTATDNVCGIDDSECAHVGGSLLQVNAGQSVQKNYSSQSMQRSSARTEVVEAEVQMAQEDKL